MYVYTLIYKCSIAINKTVEYLSVTPILLLTYFSLSFYMVTRLTHHLHVCMYAKHARQMVNIFNIS